MSKLLISLHLFLALLSSAVEPAFAEEPTNSRKLVIGAALPLTGELTEYGVAARNGIELAQTKFAKQFSGIDILFEDNKYDAKESISIFEKFHEQSVDLIYSWGEIPLVATAPLAERARLPVIAMSVDVTPALKKKYIIRNINEPKELVAPLLKVLREKGYKRYGFINVEDPYTNSCLSAFQDSLRAGESLKVLSTVHPSEKDLKIHAARLRQANIEVLGVYLYPGQVSALYRQLAAIHLDVPTFGTDIFESKSEISAAGPGMVGALYPNIDMPAWFPSEYLKKFGNESQIAYAYNSYAWAVITAEIFANRIEHPNAEKIMKMYSEAKGNEGGLTFEYRAAENGDHYFRYPIIVKEIVSGGFRKFDSAQ